jgi:hypothetical protein
MSDLPSLTGETHSGRTDGGRFAKGNKASVGNPFHKRAHAIRAALFKAVRPADIAEAVRALVEQAKAGDRQALAEILDRTIGRSIPADIEQRLTAIESALAERGNSDAVH